MPTKRKNLPYKIKHRILPNGNESKEYYAQVRNEYGKKIWLKLGTNYKQAEHDLLYIVETISHLRKGISYEQSLPNYNETFLEYLIRQHYFDPEQNVQYVFYKKTGQESYGLYHSKQVANYFHRLFDEDKANDEIGKIPYREISHDDVLQLWQRLENSTIFKTNMVRNRLLDMLSSTYRFIMKDDRDIAENPFRTVSPFDEKKETKQREGMTVKQIKLLFADEDTINSKITEYLIKQNDEEAQQKAERIKSSNKSEIEKKRLLSNLNTWREKKNTSYKEYRFTDTQYYRYFLFMMGTGIRGAECRALQYSAFSQFPYVRIEKGFKEQNSKITSIDDPKWGKKRIVYLCDSLQKMMEYAKPQGFDLYKNKTIYSQPSDHFVFSQDGGNSPLCANELRRRWTMFLCAMGFEKHLFTPHSLRHSIAALMMENGIPEWLVVQWCGWETSTVSKMVLNYAKKDWNYEYPEFEKLIAPLIEDKYFSTRK